MTGSPLFQVAQAARPRGTFGLDDRRRPDPVRIEATLRAFLAGRLPEVWALRTPVAGATPNDDASGRTLTLLLPRGHVAVLRIDRDRDHPGPVSRSLAERCLAMGVPHAIVSSVDEGRAALRRLGVEPRSGTVSLSREPTLASVFRRA